MLNLPTGVYPVGLGSETVELEVLQGQVAVYLEGGGFAIGDADSLQRQFGERIDQTFKQRLRTVIRHTVAVTVGPAQLPSVSDENVIEDIQSQVIVETARHEIGDTDAFGEEARRRWSSSSDEERASRRLLVGLRRHAKALEKPDQFLAAVNGLIRLYMQRFNDFFVEEVAVHQLASQAPLSGIHISAYCDGQLLNSHGVVERMPPIMRNPWFDHPIEQVDRFKEDLANGVAPDSVALMGVRARSFFQRGAYRSAIVESSAALDLAVSRKIREGFRKQGKADGDIDSTLRQPANQRFDERAKKLLREATGKSAAEFDNTLWSDVVEHRSKLRQGVTHADAEPPQQEAERLMEDFLRLAELIGTISV